MKQRTRCGAYLRVSTGRQDTALQERELTEYVKRRGWEVKFYEDTVSGAKESRPALDQLMEDCRKGKIDVVAVWRFDRFSRSLVHLVSALDEFRRLGVNFISATENVDTTGPTGQLVFHVFGAIAQFERALIRERIRAGLAAAKARGVRLGRRPTRVLTAIEKTKIRAARRRGVTLRKLAVQFKVPMMAVFRASRRG